MVNTPNKYKIRIDGVDVTNNVVNTRINNTDQPVKSATIIINKKVDTITTINDTVIGDEVLIQRGFDNPDERYVFRGEVVYLKKHGSAYELFCACKMHRSKRIETEYVYDKDVDTEAGVGSEIVKSLFNEIGINYTTTSVPTTGTENTIRIFLAKGKTIKSLQKLADIYGRKFFYNDSDDLGYFVPHDYNTTTTVLETGDNIVGRVVWNDTAEDIINNLTIIGGKQLDWTTETFTGSFDEVELTATPIDTDVTVGGVELERGTTSSEPKDFYVDQPNKKIKFTVTRTDPVVRYSYSVPIKVNVSDTTSMLDYYRSDNTMIETTLLTSDDAEIYASGNLEKTKDLLNSAPIKVIGNNDIEVGQEVQVIDNINDINILVSVSSVTLHYPYKPDSVNVGKLPSDEIDNDKKIINRLAELERQASTVSDINISLIPSEATLGVEAYTKLEVADADTGVLYWDSDAQGDWDDFDWGDDTEETYTEVYKEVGYDD